MITTFQQASKTPIDYCLIGEAMQYYQDLGYQYLEVPWLIQKTPLWATKPTESVALALKAKDKLLGYPVASAEQSFIQMMIQGLMPPGRSVACTPCFRDEPKHTDSTRLYFMKVELIWLCENAHTSDYMILMDHAKDFMLKHARVKPLQINPQQHDLICPDNGLELGSYGLRKFRKYTWAYGTGCAEPRLSIARTASAKTTADLHKGITV